MIYSCQHHDDARIKLNRARFYLELFKRRSDSVIDDFQANDESICHRADNPDPVLFTFGAKHMFAPKKKMCLRMFDSEWSSKTPLDAVGQSGTLMAKSARTEQIYPVSLVVVNPC